MKAQIVNFYLWSKNTWKESRVLILDLKTSNVGASPIRGQFVLEFIIE